MDHFEFKAFHVVLDELIPVNKQIEKNQAQTDVFCSKYSNSEAPISVIAKILSENYSLKLKNVSNEFDKLGFTKVKHLAQATLEKVSLVQLSEDSLTLLYGAMEIYSKRLDNLLKSAGLEFKKDNAHNSQRICKELLLHKPTDMDVIMLYSSSFYKSGNYEECINYLQIGKNIDPNCTTILFNLAKVYWEKSEVDLSKKYLFEVCRLEPTSVDKLTYYAEMSYATNDLITAELTYVQILCLQPELHKVRRRYGELLTELNKIQAAKKQFKIILKSTTGSSKTLNSLGYVYYLIHKTEKAISCYKKALEINPDLKETHGFLGLAYLKAKEYQKAATEFIKQLKLDPENRSVIRNLAASYCGQGNYILSVEVLKKFLKLEPENYEVNLDLAMIYFQHFNNVKESTMYLKKCVALSSEKIKKFHLAPIPACGNHNANLNVSDASVTLGDMHLESGEPNKAGAFFVYSILTNPENAIGHWKAGFVVFDQGLVDLAFPRYKNAIKLNPNLKFYKCEGKTNYDDYKKCMASRLEDEKLQKEINRM